MNHFDVVVIGCGNAALCAAISAHESGTSVIYSGMGAKVLGRISGAHAAGFAKTTTD